MSLPSFHIKEQNRYEISSLEQNYKVTYHTITSLWVVIGLSTPSTSQSTPCWNWNRKSHALSTCERQLYPGPWELLWLDHVHQPAFGSVKLAPIKYEKSFILRHMKSDKGLFSRHMKSNKGLFWKSSQLCIWFVNYATDKQCQLLHKR